MLLIFYLLFCVGVKPGLTLREEHGFGVFENGVLWREFGPETDDLMSAWRKSLMRSSVKYTVSQVLEMRPALRTNLKLSRAHSVSFGADVTPLASA